MIRLTAGFTVLHNSSHSSFLKKKKKKKEVSEGNFYNATYF